MIRSSRSVAALIAIMAVLSAKAQEESEADTVVVGAERLPDAQSAAPFTVRAIDADELRSAPQLRLDDILRADVPGFSLFRRNSSRTANPTTQGVTLRNFGPSGAGRTLVLLDGIPLNDPFAGYVLWNQIPPSSINSILINEGGGAGLFGNFALAGTIFLVSKPLDSDSLALEGSLGNENTYEGSLNATIVKRPFAAAVFAEQFSTSGYPVLQAGQRGRIDNNASSDSSLFDLRAGWQISSDSSVELRGRHFEDERGNGTIFTENDSSGNDFSAAFTQQFPQGQAELKLSAYGQLRQFSSTFSSVNATRTVETPALDQFDVPANAAGGSVVLSKLIGDHRVVLGSDARWVEGETEENFLWNGTRFTRFRNAGGDEFFLGAFVEDTWSPATAVTLVAGLRYDHWELFDGFRREIVRATGALLTDSSFPDRDGDEINGRAGATVQVTRMLKLRGAFYSGYRVPTLNELYRPFRVGNDVTQANPSLEPEHLLGGEAALELQPTKTLQVSITGFLNYLQDAISNVTLSQGPTGVSRQRQNVDLVLAPGLELTANWQIISSLQLKCSYLFTRPTIDQAADTSLRGKILAQTPQNVVSGGLEWTPAPKWLFRTQVRYTDRQFEDDQNSRTLAPYTTVDATAIYNVSSRLSAAVRVENLFNAEIETGKSATGLISIGAPRLVSLQLRWQL